MQVLCNSYPIQVRNTTFRTFFIEFLPIYLVIQIFCSNFAADFMRMYED